MTETKTKRLTPSDRRAEILGAALSASETHGVTNITRDQVANAAGCSAALVTTYFGSMERLRTAIVREAIKVPNLPVLAQALVARYHVAAKAPDALKKKALAAAFI